jgi:hypothetical protein
MYFPLKFSKLVKPGGQFGIVCPGFSESVSANIQKKFKYCWNEDMFSFHNLSWWRNLWNKTRIAEVTSCYYIDDPKTLWYPWAIWAESKYGFTDKLLLDTDVDNEIALIVMTATKAKK